MRIVAVRGRTVPIREPGDPLHFALHARVAERYDGPLATGETGSGWELLHQPA